MNTQEARQLSTSFLHYVRVFICVFIILIGCFSLASCIFSKNTAPTSDLSRREVIDLSGAVQHKVVRGETLFSIAWRYGLDYRQLAVANKIGNDFVIYPGQTLNLSIKEKDLSEINSSSIQATKAAPAATTKSASSSAAKSSSNVSRNVPKKTPANKPRSPRPEKKSPTLISIAASDSGSQKLVWRWPATGKVITNFSSAKADNKGIDLSGKKGDSVLAAASGTIVYAGSGLRGYGKLIIIKHNDIYLSAYAHNSRIRVKEGQKVEVGQHIADIGSSGTRANITKLHFEIRKNGQSVNPLTYLPRRKT